MPPLVFCWGGSFKILSVKCAEFTHGPVKNLGWPGMTTDFRVKDRALLNKLKAGQKVDFEIGKDASGYVIIGVSAAK